MKPTIKQYHDEVTLDTQNVCLDHRLFCFGSHLMQKSSFFDRPNSTEFTCEIYWNVLENSSLFSEIALFVVENASHQEITRN